MAVNDKHAASYDGEAGDPGWSTTHHAVVTFSDTVNLPFLTTDLILNADTAANVKVTDACRNAVTIRLRPGSNPRRVWRVWATGTDATAGTVMAADGRRPKEAP